MTILLANAAKKRGYKYYPYQAEMIEQMLLSPSPLLYNGSSMGVGKTPMAYGYAYNLGVENMLVICPASLRINWLRESIWGGPNLKDGLAILNSKDLQHIQSKGRWKEGRDPSLVIVSYDMLVSNQLVRKYVQGRNWDIITADEFHFCRNLEAQRTQVVCGLLSRADNFLLLSGTPMMKSAADLFPALMSIVPELDYMGEEDREICSDFRRFANTFTYCYMGRYAMQYKRVRNADRLKQIMKEDGKFFYRKTKEQVLHDLPEKTFHKVELSFDVETSLSVDEIARFLSNFTSEEGGTASKAQEKPIIAKLRHDLGDAKAASPESKEFVESLLEAGNPVILFAYHKSVIAKLMETFKAYKPVKLDGSTTPANKQAAVDAFQSGKTDVFIGQINAASVGITLTRAADAVFYELTYLPSDFLQAIDRLHRIGQKNAVSAHVLMSQNKLDQGIAKEMIKKQRAIEKVF